MIYKIFVNRLLNAINNILQWLHHEHNAIITNHLTAEKTKHIFCFSSISTLLL